MAAVIIKAVLAVISNSSSSNWRIVVMMFFIIIIILFTVKQNYLHAFINPNIHVGRCLFTLAGNNKMNMQEDCITTSISCELEFQWGIAASNLFLLTNLSLHISDRKINANSPDPDQTSYATSVRSLHRLQLAKNTNQSLTDRSAQTVQTQIRHCSGSAPSVWRLTVVGHTIS